MQWETRTLEKLLAEKPHYRPGTGELVVMVNPDEGRLLGDAGARVISGSENLQRNTQRYELGGKTYFWLAGYGYPDSDWDDPFPVNNVDPRLREILEEVKQLGGVD